MSTKIIAVAAAFTLLGVGACTGVSAPSTNATAAKATAAQAAPEANAAPTAANSPVPAATAETAAPAAKPVEAAPAGTAAEPASEAKPAAAEEAAIPPAAKPAAAAAPAAKSATLTREQALALAQKGNCLACHKIESKVVGPAWKDVAAKYRGDANAVATITSHIKSGGSFGWKFGTMPPRGGSKISDAEVASLAKFIASLK